MTLSDAYITERSSNDSWNTQTCAAARIPYIERASQNPTTIDFEIKFLGSERYNVATSVIAEIEKCEEVLVRNDGSKKLYGTDEWFWLKQSEFAITEEAGHRLIGHLSGNLDPRMIHSCDFSTNWAGDGTISTDSPHDGKQCIKHTVTGPSGATTYEFAYTPADALDLSDFVYIRFWIKSAQPSGYYDHIRVYVKTNDSNYGYWGITITSANTWYFKKYALASPRGETGTLDLSSITSIMFSMRQPTEGEDMELYIDSLTLQ